MNDERPLFQYGVLVGFAIAMIILAAERSAQRSHKITRAIAELEELKKKCDKND